MSKKIGAIVMAITLAAVLLGVGWATGNGEEIITVTLAKNIHVQSKGEDLAMTDWTGQQLYPIQYNGNIYVPVRAVGNALNAAVEWDEATQTVSVGGDSESANMGLGATDNAEQFLAFVLTPIDSSVEIYAMSNAADFNQLDLNIGGRQNMQNCIVGNSDAERPVTVTFSNRDTGEVVYTETIEQNGTGVMRLPVANIRCLRVTAEYQDIEPEG